MRCALHGPLAAAAGELVHLDRTPPACRTSRASLQRCTCWRLRPSQVHNRLEAPRPRPAPGTARPCRLSKPVQLCLLVPNARRICQRCALARQAAKHACVSTVSRVRRNGARPNLQPSGADSSGVEEVQHARAALLVDERVGSHGQRSAAVRGACGGAARLKVERARRHRSGSVHREHAADSQSAQQPPPLQQPQPQLLQQPQLLHQRRLVTLRRLESRDCSPSSRP